jgi:putative MATE family efflux protein
MVRMSIPGMVGMIIMSVHNIVDTLWVSGLPDGTEAVAALTVMFPVQMIAGAVGMGIAMGLTSLVSRRLGEDRRRQAQRGAGNGIALAAGFGIVLTLLAITASEPAVKLFGATPEIVDRAAGYLRYVGLAFPFFMVGLALDGLYRGGGNIITPMCLMGLSALLNAGLDPLLIYGLGPFPRLALDGAAIATAISQVTAASVSLVYLRSGRAGFHLIRSDFRPDLAIIKDIGQVGAPATAMNSLRSVVASVFNWVLGGFGPAAIAAHGLSLRVMMLVISCLGGGVHQALMPIVGYNFGGRNYRRMWDAYKIAAVWTSAGGLLIGGAVIWYAEPILAPFAKEPELLELSVISLRLKMSTFFLVEPQMMALFALEGMGFGGRAMVLTLSRGVILVIPALFLLSAWLGVTGAFMAQPVADVLSLFIAGAVLWRVYRKYPPQVSG